VKRDERVGRNEALFREVNEQVESLNRAFATTGEDRIDIVCECGDLTCIERLAVPVATYERVRGESTLFFVKPGHQQPEIEDVVEQTGTYNVVRKRSDGARLIAEVTDPRAQ
jgi:hypothetical protein